MLHSPTEGACLGGGAGRKPGRKSLDISLPTPGRSLGNCRGWRGQSAAQPCAERRLVPKPPRKVFFLRGSEETSAFLPLLLLLAGDIETNPGPYPCLMCSRPYNRRMGSLQCPCCKSWTHYNTHIKSPKGQEKLASLNEVNCAEITGNAPLCCHFL